ncbi:MAG: CRISPR-associated RAMP protein Csx7, partial [Syntrophobacteraceae bacterium]
MSSRKELHSKVKITGTLTFETAFHIGSGKEGELATDMGILKEIDGSPVLPGSTLKGNFRALAERLAGYLRLSACLLDGKLSGVDCVSDEAYRTSEPISKKIKSLEDEAARIEWLKGHTCDVCKLFGSPMQASRVFFSDGRLQDWAQSVQVRDGVCIDRDSETARPGAKYDFEVAPHGAIYSISIDLENPQDEELALVGAVLAEWENGFRLGGFTSRGLGKVKLDERIVEMLDYTDPEQLRNYLLK